MTVTFVTFHIMLAPTLIDAIPPEELAGFNSYGVTACGICGRDLFITEIIFDLDFIGYVRPVCLHCKLDRDNVWEI